MRNNLFLQVCFSKSLLRRLCKQRLADTTMIPCSRNKTEFSYININPEKIQKVTKKSYLLNTQQISKVYFGVMMKPGQPMFIYLYCIVI